LQCGSLRHHRKDCPVQFEKEEDGPDRSVPVPSNKQRGPPLKQTLKVVVTDTTDGAPGEGGKPGRGRGRKRRSGDRTGLTPQAKRRSPARKDGPQGPTSKNPKTERFSFAEMAAGAQVAALVREDKSHVTRQVFEEVQEGLNKMFVLSAKQNEYIPDVERWTYSTTYATVAVSDDKSWKTLRSLVFKMGFLLIPQEELIESRAPTRIYSGLIKGPTAKLSEDDLGELVKRQALTNGIKGRFEVINTVAITSSGNKILRLRVDDRAREGFERVKCELRLAMAGRIRFTDVKSVNTLENKRSKGKASAEQRLGELELEIAKQRAVIAELEEVETAMEHETSRSAASSLGMSNLRVDAEVPTPTDEEAEALLASEGENEETPPSHALFD
jgi:hypothetical protein